MTTQTYIGIMTGNSMDAADAVLMAFDNAPRIVKTNRTAMPAALAAALRRVAESEQVVLSDVLKLQNDITQLCANAAAPLIESLSSQNESQQPAPIIGCHGQTIAHQPEDGITCQLLNGALLAKLTQCDVVCDFRSRDVAAGGQGAPLAPLFHQAFFGAHAPCDIVNIGGISNITHLSDANEVRGYDISAGMMLSDAWYQQHHPDSAHRYDKDGALAQQGKVSDEVLQKLLAHPFHQQPPPKSCGRETFALQQFAEALRPLSAADGQATLLEFTARTIAAAVCAPRLLLCGGGSHNPFLVKRIAALTEATPTRTDDYGCPAAWVEAATFAWLAHCFITRTPLQTAAVTNGKPHIAGAHYPA